MLPINVFAILAGEGTVTQGDVSTFLWSLLSGSLLVIGFLIVRYMNNIDRHYEKLEAKVDAKFEQFDNRMDKMEISQAKILHHLGIK